MRRWQNRQNGWTRAQTKTTNENSDREPENESERKHCCWSLSLYTYIRICPLILWFLMTSVKTVIRCVCECLSVSLARATHKPSTCHPFGKCSGFVCCLDWSWTYASCVPDYVWPSSSTDCDAQSFMVSPRFVVPIPSKQASKQITPTTTTTNAPSVGGISTHE